MVACIYCKRKVKIVSRKLCSRCYCDLEIRTKYPVKKRTKWKKHTGDFSRFKPNEIGTKQGVMPAGPTQEPPGSAAKAKIMEERVGRGESPNHPDDIKDTDKNRGWPARVPSDNEGGDSWTK